MTDAHLPTRPAWTCHACTRPWPCLPARRALHTDIERGGAVVVARLLGDCLATAAKDRPDLPVRALYRQLLGWLLAIPRTPTRTRLYPDAGPTTMPCRPFGLPPVRTGCRGAAHG